MKIVCEACQAKYSISDDKVRGKAFKIRCKKCSHIIVVRSGEGSGVSPQPEPVGVPAPAAETATWHIVLDGEQVGPLSESDIRARLSRGEISGETYIWREGMGDWLKISTVPDFADGSRGGYDEPGSPFPGGQQAPAAAYPPGTTEGAFAASAENGELDAFAAPTVVSSSAAASELFASSLSAPASSEPAGFSFGASSPSSESGGGGGRHGGGGGGGGGLSVGNGAPAASGGGGLTGQRHENSVLFSLSNLEALAAPPSAAVNSSPRPGTTAPTEGSGLIDIRSMAAMTLGSSGNEARGGGDLPTFAAPQFSPVAPVLLPIAPHSGPGRWQYALLGVLVLVALGLGVVSYNLYRGSQQQAAAPAPSPEAVTAPAAPAPGAATAPPATPAPAPDEPLPPREEKPGATASAEKPAARPDRPRTGKPGAERRPGRPGESGRPVASAPAAPAATAEPAEKVNVGKGDRLDDLLSQALGSKGRPAAGGGGRARDEDEPARKPAASLPPLAKEDIVRGIQGVMPRIKECYNNYKVPGTATVNISVARGGRVSDANVTGKFAGTPTGNCVETAVKQAKFPPSEAQNFPYPIFLR